MILVAVYFVRIILRDVVVPIYNYSGIIKEEFGIMKDVVDFEEIFYGFTDFLVAFMILYLFYMYSSEASKKPRKKKTKTISELGKSKSINRNSIYDDEND